MRRLPLLLALVAGVALWAAPSQAQVADFYTRYVADSAAPGENVVTLPNGYELCPPNTDGCTGYSQAHHDIDGDAAAPYNTDVMDVHNCNYVTVCVKTADQDGTHGEAFVESVSNNAGANNLPILADINGDGVIDANDYIPLDGDPGDDSASSGGSTDGVALQTMCLYDITGHNKVRLNVTVAGGAADDSYAEVSCR